MLFLKKIILGLLVVVAVVGLVGFFIAPPVIKWVVTDKMSAALHRKASIDKISINPFAFSATVRGFKLEDPDGAIPFVTFDELRINADLMPSLYRRALILKKISLINPYLGILRRQDGSYNFSDLLVRDKDETKPAGDEKPFLFSLNNIEIVNGEIDFQDEPNKTRHTARDINVSIPFISNISYYVENYIEPKFSARINDNKIELLGKTRPFLTSRATSFDVDIQDVDIPFYLNYIPVKMNCQLKSARLDTKMKINFLVDKDNSPSLALSGIITLKDVVLDDLRNKNILRLPLLNVDAVSVEPFASRIHLAKIFLMSPKLFIRRNENGEINLLNLYRQERQLAKKDGGAADSGKKTEFKFQIDDFVLEDADINFGDGNIKPNYSVSILDIDGRVTGLSSDKSSRADVRFKGNLGFGSPLAISGKINPLAKDIFADIKVNFQNVEMSSLTPYTNKYLGYPINKGKLSFNVAYLIDKRKLDSENRIIIDQLIFGDRVESPEAIKAPVTLAVSLLTDRNGKINLDIPVWGSLDDPEFKVWSVVWQIIVNLITKAAASPFDLLVSLTGVGEELSFIEFNYGGAAVTEDGRKKITLISKALVERPNIKLDIEGCVDAQKDKEGLKREEFNRQIKAQKLKEIMKRGEQETAIESVHISSQEYDKYLKQAYRAADFSKPRNILGMQKDLPSEEMEKLMLANIEVTDSDLRQLALKRAQNVKELFLQSGEVSAERIFTIEPKIFVAEQTENVKNSRINFKLK